MKKPLFIAFEGIDGSGKSTQAKILAERLIQDGEKVYHTHEPSSGVIGKMIRTILKGETKSDERTIAGLFVADRLDHILNQENGMLLKLEQGEHVITDRYYFSSYAYHACHMDMNWVIDANAMSAELLKPDVTFFVDVSAEESMKRINNNRASIERYETLENLEKVRQNYLKAFTLQEHKERIIFIDGQESQEKVSAAIWEKLQTLRLK